MLKKDVAKEVVYDLEDASVDLELLTHVFEAINIAMCEGSSLLNYETLMYPCSELQKISNKIKSLIEKFFAENEV